MTATTNLNPISLKIDFQGQTIKDVLVRDGSVLSTLPSDYTPNLATKIHAKVFPRFQKLQSFAVKPNFSIVVTPDAKTAENFHLVVKSEQEIDFMITKEQLQQIFGEPLGVYFKPAPPKPTAPAAPSDPIRKIPGDGNCLFHAFGTTLGKTHGALRKEANDWLKKNQKDAAVEPLIGYAIDDYKAHQKELLLMEHESIKALFAAKEITEGRHDAMLQAIQERLVTLEKTPISSAQYFDMAAKDRFHGSRAEIYALSQKYQMPVTIVLMNEGIPSISEFIGQDFPKDKRLVLVHNGNHFDVMDNAFFDSFFGC
jgi:hypothetical protein